MKFYKCAYIKYRNRFVSCFLELPVQYMYIHIDREYSTYRVVTSTTSCPNAPRHLVVHDNLKRSQNTDRSVRGKEGDSTMKPSYILYSEHK